jgi:DNA gyrase/topoisomerase IV subunit A
MVAAILAKKDDEIVATTANNKTNKISVGLISQSGRNAQGVKLCTLDDGDVLSNISIV